VVLPPTLFYEGVQNELKPNIFDFGGCKTQRQGTSHEQSFIIIRGDGETKTFPLIRKLSIIPEGITWSSSNKIVDELINREKGK